jgi:hypothetical protein
MKILITAVVALIGFSVSGDCAELNFAAGKASLYLNFSLHRLDKEGFKSRKPDNDFDDQLVGKLIWKNLDPGTYRIVIDPDEENFDSHWIGIQTVKVAEGSNKVDLDLPKGHVVFSVSFEGIAVPEQHMNESQLILRAERLLEDGSVDPLYLDWVWCHRQKKPLQGELLYLLPGRYRLTAFSIDEQFKKKDVGAGVVELTKADIEAKAAKVTISKIVEQGGAGQPATRSQSKSEGGDKPQPEAEGRSR